MWRLVNILHYKFESRSRRVFRNQILFQAILQTANDFTLYF